ncbi:MAG: hypothetical protein QHC90_15620 [Shinella sp.]|nr:hypothetical protein [Shinella sp.]
MTPKISTDDVVNMALEDIFPGHIKPDENNHITKGQQYKAPDHSILNGGILIERKSRNAEDNSQFYYKLSKIAESQGMPFYGFGKLNLAHVIQNLPDPEDATKRMTDFMMRQIMKRLGDARKKFEAHAQHVPGDPLRVVIVSDNTNIKSSTAPETYYFARKMGAFDPDSDETGLIDAILLIKNPGCVLDEENSYWFKCIYKKRLSAEKRDLFSRLAGALHHRIAHYGPYFHTARSFKNCSMQMLVV